MPRLFADWVTGDLITATKLNQMKNAAFGGGVTTNTSIAAGTTFAFTITVTGAKVGDAVTISTDPTTLFSPGTIIASATVTAADTVTVRLQNYGAAASATGGIVTISVVVIPL